MAAILLGWFGHHVNFSFDFKKKEGLSWAQLLWLWSFLSCENFRTICPETVSIHYTSQTSKRWSFSRLSHAHHSNGSAFASGGEPVSKVQQQKASRKMSYKERKPFHVTEYFHFGSLLLLFNTLVKFLIVFKVRLASSTSQEAAQMGLGHPDLVWMLTPALAPPPVVTLQKQCRRLWCTSAEGVHKGCRTQHMPLADGTSCGPGMVGFLKGWVLYPECLEWAAAPQCTVSHDLLLPIVQIVKLILLLCVLDRVYYQQN